MNCHGRYVGQGPIVNSVRALELIAADGTVHELSRERDPSLFHAVIGGYGGLDLISEVELDLDQNARIERRVERVSLDDYPAFFRDRIAADPDLVLHNADLAPPDLDAPMAISWFRTDVPLTESRRLIPRNLDYSRDQDLIWSASELPGSGLLRERFLTSKLLHDPTVVWRHRHSCERLVGVAALASESAIRHRYKLA